MDAHIESLSKGVAISDWEQSKQILTSKLEQVVEAKLENPTTQVDDATKATCFLRLQQCIAMLNAFEGPPFTVQRLSELLAEPDRQYSSVSKYMNGVEKLLSVSSTTQSFEFFEHD